MDTSRRKFISGTGAALLAMGVERSKLNRFPMNQVLKPNRLKEGNVVGVVSPAGITYDSVQVEMIEEILDAQGLRMKPAKHMLERWGYLAGEDDKRADDINIMFADPQVDAIFALHGGWGAARLLPLINYDLIRENPKIFMGYSDITALLVAFYARTGLVTFHGPNGNSSWNRYSAAQVKKMLFDAEAVKLENPKDKEDYLTQRKNRISAITEGKARGKMVGGNLTVLSAIIGSNYLPDWEGHILFLEDIGESVYRIDRMLTQLKLAGVLENISGFVFGKCTDCTPDSGYSSFTLEEVLRDHIRGLGIPAWHGSMIGHIEDKFTIPIGIEVEIDASEGSITLMEAAVN